MRSKHKSDEIEALVLGLLSDDSQVSIRSIAAARGKSKDDITERRAIRRALVALEQKDLIAP